MVSELDSDRVMRQSHAKFPFFLHWLLSKKFFALMKQMEEQIEEQMEEQTNEQTIINIAKEYGL